MLSPDVTTAPHLYARLCGADCQGRHRCHWCGSPCGEGFPHDDVPAHPGFARNPHKARHVSEPFICVGCWLWRRTRVTAHQLGGGYKDLQSPRKLSWLLAADGARSIDTDRDRGALLLFLIRPTLPFALLLLTDPKIANELHLAAVNNPASLEAATPLTFTLNNVPHSYTVYELEEALRSGDPAGTEPGVQALCRSLATASVRDGLKLPEPVVPAAPEEEAKRGRGRPKNPAEPRTAESLRKPVPAA